MAESFWQPHERQGRTRAEGPWSGTDLRVEGGRRGARAADKLHKEGPVLESERQVRGAEGRDAADGKPSGEEVGDERQKQKQGGKEGNKGTRGEWGKKRGGERETRPERK